MKLKTSVAVAYFLPGRAKDLQATLLKPHNSDSPRSSLLPKLRTKNVISENGNIGW